MTEDELADVREVLSGCDLSRELDDLLAEVLSDFVAIRETDEESTAVHRECIGIIEDFKAIDTEAMEMA